MRTSAAEHALAPLPGIDDDLEAANFAFDDPSRVAALPFRFTGDELRFPYGPAVRRLLANPAAVTIDGIPRSELVVDRLIEEGLELSPDARGELLSLPLGMIGAIGSRCAAKARRRWLLTRNSEIGRRLGEDHEDIGLRLEARRILDELDAIASFLADHDGRSAQTRQPFPLIPFEEIERQLEDDYLVKGVLSRGTFAALIGAPGGSKTFVALELALAIASGTPWRGVRTRRGRVVYIAAEGAAGLRNRVTAARQRLALGDPRSVGFTLVPEVVRLVDGADDAERLASTIRAVLPAQGVDLFVIDTLSRAIAGRDENSAADMTEAIARADRLRSEFGAAVLLVHHSGKDESRGARGHSSLRAALDTELEVRKLGDTFALTLSKAREHETGRVWHHRLELVEIGVDPDGDPISSCIVRPLSDDDIENGSKPHLNANEERTLTALRALLAVADGTSLTAPDSAPKDALRDWVERHAGVSHALRRNVVLKGLKGLKSKGIVEIERDRVFLVRDDLS